MNVRKINKFIALLFAIVVIYLYSCNNEIEKVTNIEISVNTLDLSKIEQYYIQVDTLIFNSKAIPDENGKYYLKNIPQGNYSIKILAENFEEFEKTEEFKNDSTISVIYTLTKKEALLSISPLGENVSYTAGNVHFNIAAKSDWKAETKENWIKCIKNKNDKNRLVVEFRKNASQTPRTATIKITTKEAIQTVSITQQAYIPNTTVNNQTTNNTQIVKNTEVKNQNTTKNNQNTNNTQIVKNQNNTQNNTQVVKNTEVKNQNTTQNNTQKDTNNTQVVKNTEVNNQNTTQNNTQKNTNNTQVVKNTEVNNQNTNQNNTQKDTNKTVVQNITVKDTNANVVNQINNTIQKDTVKFTQPIIEEIIEQPVVVTNTASQIEGTGASIMAEISNANKTRVTKYGHCWSTKPDAKISQEFTTSYEVDSTFEGSYVSKIKNLAPNTTYYVRAYATDINGTHYSNEITFSIIANAPVVTSSKATFTDITVNSIKMKADITNNGNSAITEHGFCWSMKNQSPTLEACGGKILNGALQETSTYENVITQLKENSTYYLRAFATNNIGTTYSEPVKIKTKKIIEGLVFDMPFNGNMIDEGPYKFTGQVYGTILTSDRFGKDKKAAQFDGNEDFIIFGNILDNVFSANEYTIVLWVEINNYFVSTTFSPGCILSKWHENEAIDNSFYISGYGGFDTETKSYYPNTSPSLNEWHMLAIVVNTDGATIYQDGKLETISNGHKSNSTSFPLIIGSSAMNYGNCFDGKIDDLRIYKRTLSEEEIVSLYIPKKE